MAAENKNQFVVIRLGKDSVDDIRQIDKLPYPLEEPLDFRFSCKQVESKIAVGAYAFIYLGSDNNKGIATDWKKGLRCIARIEKIDGWENFQSTCTLTLKIFLNFPESVEKHDFLEKTPGLYRFFSDYPVIGLTSSRNNAIQLAAEGRSSSSSAVLTSLSKIIPRLQEFSDVFLPELKSLYGFSEEKAAKNTDGEAISESGSQKLIGENKIFFGAPGVGKSFAIDRSINLANTVRTVFHEDYTHSDFVGSYKPVLDETSGDRSIIYAFSPGPFAIALSNALRDPNNHHYLVIEELNRGRAANILGDIFQLLDRDDNGDSQYQIDFVDPAFKRFISQETSSNLSKITIPHNLSIFASLNSADQGVYSLDTAFKRRWEFVHIPISFDHAHTIAEIDIKFPDGNIRQVSWKSFAIAINNALLDLGIPEDRCLGQFFVTQKEAGDRTLFFSKVFLYLWEDVLRFENKASLFDPKILTFSDLKRCFLNHEVFLSESIFDGLMSEAQDVDLDLPEFEAFSQFSEEKASDQERDADQNNAPSVDEG